MAQRAHGEGSIWREGPYWVGALIVGGRRRKVKATTRKEAAAKLSALRHAAATGSLVDANRLTVGGWLDRWMGGRTRISARTLEGYRSHVEHHIKPAIGHLPLSRLTVANVEAMCQKVLRDGAAQTTVHHIGMTLRIALNRAVQLRLLAANVAAVAEIPAVRTKEMETWDETECRAFLRAAQGHPLEALFRLALATGMRKSEILALRWSAVDLDGATIVVKAALGRTGRTNPKNRTSIRLLRLDRDTVDLLRAHLGAQKIVSMRSDPPLFQNGAGTSVDQSHLSRREFEPLMRRASVRRIRFHDIRHTFATLMLSHGVPVKDVAYMLGHADPATTLRVYAHAIPATHGDHARVLGTLLSGRALVRDGPDR